MKPDKIGIAISMGDPSGIGPEVISKAVPVMRRIIDADFFIFGDSIVMEKHGFKESANISLIDISSRGSVLFKPGVSSFAGLRASMKYLNAAVLSAKSGRVQALVTGPICKEGVKKCGFKWQGHTEFLADSFGVKRFEMVFISESLKVILLTRHMSLLNAIKNLNKKYIFDCGSLAVESLKNLFKIKDPKIALCGLNPHAGESGLFGDEEKNIIIPAVKKLNRKYAGCFFGPFPSDTLFYRALKGEFDLVMAMYHDQGLIPFKLLEFNSGVNLTIGLPIIRTSPVHGTAYGIAGKRSADPGSMIAAVELAVKLVKNSYR